ncbi:23S rRNA (adenine(2030)-N(6))-methyltransferase RlmJ [Hyphococcus sp.]|jgi:23S rRNA (adenine2030-N6)-methyltransferase|uniref:23S rRNA (adenine(2030)-N(6))-methyltransferase RlmJ n=1 Tax=Hyphococcus sp. TaxID=2038636 RepID=UPI003D0B59D1
MNYRHAYHAGNHADVLKHVALARVIEHLKQKDAPFRFYDAHGGIGSYDLGGVEAEKTLEWREGVGRLFSADGAPLKITESGLAEEAEALLAPWRECVSAANDGGALKHYPGSPEIARLLLRPADKLRFNELHPADYETLSARYARDKRVAVSNLDALVFLKSQLPPPERRGLVLIDPPYEKTDEADRALQMLSEGLKRFATGVFVLWFPVTGDGLDRRIKDAVREMEVKSLWATMNVRKPRPDGGLAGSGVVIVNPPWKLGRELEVVLPALAERLSQGAPSFEMKNAAP